MVRTIEQKTAKMLDLESAYGTNIEEVVRSMFVDENKSAEQIGAELGISYVTTLTWIHKAGIYGRRINLGDG